MSAGDRSTLLWIRGLRLHVRHFGARTGPLLLLLHGWLDASASFVPVVRRVLGHHCGALRVAALDWRGHGYSQWVAGGYWFPDYLADLDAVIDDLSPHQPVILIGHSMGAQVASLYAGLRPRRVSALACLDGFNLPNMSSARAPRRYRAWLDQLTRPPEPHSYADFEALAQRILQHHPRLDAARARFVARCWAHEGADGRVHLLADPQHRLRGPGLYRAAESQAIWRLIEAPTLLVQCGESEYREAITPAQRSRRQACFRRRRVAVLDGVGHMLHFEQPYATGDLLADFLRETPLCA